MDSINPIDNYRAIIRNRYGKDFADKASDALCATMAAPAPAHTEAFESMAVHQPGVVIEFVTQKPDTQKASSLRESKPWKRLKEVLSDTNAATEAIIPQAEQFLRQVRVSEYRENSLKTINPITDQLERSLSRLYAVRRESLSDQPGPTRVCWLNQSVQTLTEPFALAEIAAHTDIARIDIPRQLRAELNQTGTLLGVAGFRNQFAKTGKGIIVAVIDSEVALNHPSLTGRVVHRQNYTKESWGNPDSHGTAVAGIIASNDTDFSGMAPDAMIYNYKVLATNRLLNASEFEGTLAIQRALEDGVHIANCSWGAGSVSNGQSREAIACNNAWELGLTIVKSAGNSGPTGLLTTPGDATGIIVVGATDKRGRVVQSYSSRGILPFLGDPTDPINKRPHFVVPGGGFSPPPGSELFSCLVAGGFGTEFNGAPFIGTSFAAPHVAGVLALLLEQNSELTPDQQRDALISLCVHIEGQPAEAQGAGLLQLQSLINTIG